MVFVAAFLAGAINSVAGGGTLISFPALIWLGPEFGHGERHQHGRDLAGNRRQYMGIPPRIARRRTPFPRVDPPQPGGRTGGRTAPALDAGPDLRPPGAVPDPVRHPSCLWRRKPCSGCSRRPMRSRARSAKWLIGAILFQLAVGIYGGYFGAGIGILMLAALSILGLKDIHEMNSLKVVFGGSINGIAAAYFIWARMVYWPYVVIMAVGAIVGGYGGAGMARKLGRATVRRIVIAIGFAMAVSLFIRK